MNNILKFERNNACTLQRDNNLYTQTCGLVRNKSKIKFLSSAVRVMLEVYMSTCIM